MPGSSFNIKFGVVGWRRSIADRSTTVSEKGTFGKASSVREAVTTTSGSVVTGCDALAGVELGVEPDGAVDAGSADASDPTDESRMAVQ